MKRQLRTLFPSSIVCILAMLLITVGMFSQEAYAATDSIRIRQYTASSSSGSSSAGDDGNGHTSSSTTSSSWQVEYNWQGASIASSAYGVSWYDSNLEGNGPCSGWSTNTGLTVWSGPSSSGTSYAFSAYSSCIDSDSGGATNTVDPIEWPNPFVKSYYFQSGYSTTNYDEETGWTTTTTFADQEQQSETQLDLITGGATNGGSQTLWLVVVTAHENYTDTPINPSGITILGETPDSQGRVLKLIANNSTNDLTPSFSGLPSNHAVHFEISASPMRLYIEDSEAQNISGQTITNWVGQRVANSARISNEEDFVNTGYSITVTNYSWSIADNRIFSNYYHSSVGAVSNYVAKTNSSISFCWHSIAGSASLGISAVVIVGSEEFTLASGCDYVVLRPTAGMSLVSGNDVEIYPDENLDYWVQYQNSFPFGIPGMTIEASFQPVDGEFAFLQKVNSAYTSWEWTNQTVSIAASGLDISFPLPLTDSGSGWIKAEDSPAGQLNAYNGWYLFGKADHFSTYLMYRRTSNDSWVPIKVGNWQWSAVVSASYSLHSYSFPTYTPVDTSAHPIWSQPVGASLVITTNSIP